VALALELDPVLAAASDLRLQGTELWLDVPGHRVRLGAPIDLADKARVLQVLLTEDLPAGATIDLVAPGRPAVVEGSTGG
jgi:hypothetical protein